MLDLTLMGLCIYFVGCLLVASFDIGLMLVVWTDVGYGLLLICVAFVGCAWVSWGFAVWCLV